MEKKRLNQNWLFQDLTNRYECTVNLPHDATIGTERTQDGHTYFLNAGFRGVHCLYTKKIWIPEEYRGRALYLEFEGIYRDFTVSINGKSILEENYGYIPYEVQIDDCVIYGGENVLQVEINTPEEGHNRWYAASGIYQDVFLYVGDPIHIPLHGVKVTTKSHNPAVISVEVALKGTERADVDVEIRDGVHTVAHAQGQTVQFEIPHAKLWTAETPNLYTAVVTVKKDGRVCDQAEQSFGIRTLEWDSERGFLVNGCRTLLKGGCIHNDNGVIGQVTNRITEERRIKNLKATGFNALRSAHHPMSPALLEMCDRYGMYVMDESFDTWYRMKQRNGYHTHFMDSYEDITARMARKDYNHPCVILYSIGNEINEIGSLKGVRVGKRMVEILKEEDGTRPTVMCPSMKMARHFLQDTPYASMDEDAYIAQGPEYAKKDFDHYLWLYLKAISNIPGTADDPYPQAVRQEDEAVTAPLYSVLDIAGYNYYSANFPYLHQLHPERVLLGTETRGHLIYQNWKFIQEHPYAIGDFIWTLQDHIGEANVCGRRYEGEPDDTKYGKGRAYPWLLNDGGVVDLLGHTLPAIHKYRMCWGEEHGIFLAAQPPIHHGIPATYDCYKWTDSIDCWSFEGLEGQPTFVDVYSDAAEVEVLVNGMSLGRQTPVEYFAKFPCVYAPGEVTGIGYDASGREIYRTSLKTAGKETVITLTPDKTVLKADTQDFCFLNVDITDRDGVVKAFPERKLTIHVEGAASLQGFGSAEPVTDESFCDHVHTTYHGRAMAVLRSTDQAGDIQITVCSDGLPDSVIHLKSE